MFNETIKATGQLTVQLFGPDGQIKEQHDLKNLVVSVGRTFIAARMVGTPTVMSNMALGSSTVAAVVADSTLGAELGRVALSASSSASNVVTYTATFPAGTATGAVTEAGVFNASAAGTLLCRTVFPVVNKGAGDTMGVTWNVSIN